MNKGRVGLRPEMSEKIKSAGQRLRRRMNDTYYLDSLIKNLPAGIQISITTAEAINAVKSWVIEKVF